MTLVPLKIKLDVPGSWTKDILIILDGGIISSITSSVGVCSTSNHARVTIAYGPQGIVGPAFVGWLSCCHCMKVVVHLSLGHWETFI